MANELIVVPLKVLYRYENNSDEIALYFFRIVKETSQGVWIDHWGKKKFVLKGDDGKRFGYRTKEAALKSFQRRKVIQIRILSAQLQNSKTALQSVHGLTPSQVESLEGFKTMESVRYIYDGE